MLVTFQKSKVAPLHKLPQKHTEEFMCSSTHS